mmetsp:Transcript_5356/g.22688  ORF Transcript_5356/g.22688 Transcript_5356/m.22688 type:complete len:127 (-) Transcript_5356:1889-2269(-)
MEPNVLVPTILDQLLILVLVSSTVYDKRLIHLIPLASSAFPSSSQITDARGHCRVVNSYGQERFQLAWVPLTFPSDTRFSEESQAFLEMAFLERKMEVLIAVCVTTEYYLAAAKRGDRPKANLQGL